jgi:hypothetical protein
MSGDHKAFAVSPSGSYGWMAGKRTKLDARASALEGCGKHSDHCSIYAVGDKLESELAARAAEGLRPAAPAR